jgi:V8-like Glu-specific endopeptidase
MEESVNEDIIKVVTENTKELIELNSLGEALEVLKKYFSPISKKIATSVLLNTAAYNSLKEDLSIDIITHEAANVAKAKIKLNLLAIIDDLVPKEIKIKLMLGNLKQSIYKTTSNENLEKILGTDNHMVKINWLQKGIQYSKSVCQVLVADGGKGTGFVLEDGYLMTNSHVIPSKKLAKSAKLIFDYEEDLSGNLRKTSEFILEADDAKFSPMEELDYAYIKIKDNPSNPLSQWGYLEIDAFSEPRIDQPVNIIQHPLGQSKQIALTANKIISIDNHKLFYQTDTERGSSGSPVFNNEWKVVALHHAGITEEDGGLVINSKTGERRGANEGILIKHIVQHIGAKIKTS